MKKLVFTTMFLLLCAVFTLAQTPGNQSSNNPSQTGTSSTSGQTGSQMGTTTPSTQDQTPPSSTSPSSQSGTASTPSGAQDTSSTGSTKSQTASSSTKGEKKIEGCLESAGSGQFVVTHKGKQVAVIPEGSASSDLSSNVGHKVKVYGTWEQGASTTAMNNPSSMPQSDQPGAAGSSTSKSTDASKNAKEFRASRVESVSDQCNAGKNSNPSSTTPKP